MDALSLALRSITLTSPLIARLRIADHASVSLSNPGEAPARSFPFHYVIDGACWLRLGEQSIALAMGDIVLLPHWSTHDLACGSGSERFVMSDLIRRDGISHWTEKDGMESPILMEIGSAPISAVTLGGIFTFEGAQSSWLREELPALIHIPASRHSLAGLVKAALELVNDEQPDRPGYAAVVSRLLEAVLVETLRTWIIETDHPAGNLRAIVDPTIARAVHAIHDRPGEKWTVAALARIAGRSRSSFFAHFSHIVGRTPHAYMQEVRCRAAERLLITTNDSATAVAASLGYGSAFAFSRVFRQVTGETPSAYRRRHLRDARS